MNVRTKHSLAELMVRAKMALKEDSLIDIVEANKKPNGAQKTAVQCGFKEKAYSVWALAALKRDYSDDYNDLQEVQNLRKLK